MKTPSYWVLALAAFGAVAQAADVVLVIENSPGMEPWVAVVAFTDKARVTQPLTDDTIPRAGRAAAVRRQGPNLMPPPETTLRELQSIGAAEWVMQVPGRQRR